MSTEVRRPRALPTNVLRGVDWQTYLRLRKHHGNDHLRLSYLDGTLILVSPESIHDLSGRRLGLVIDLVTEALEMPIQGTATTTLRKSRGGPRKGTAKEPDQGFYFGRNALRMQRRPQIDLEIDPPPDLAIEIDNKADSSKALTLYARIGVPEVWRYRAKGQKLWFGKLVGERYESIERSLNITQLTPDLVLIALARLGELGETAAKPWIREWARTLPDPAV